MGYKVKRIYVGTTKVRPVSKYWDTSSSTVCYYKFEDNNTDTTGNTSLSNGGTKQTLGYKFSGNSSISLNISNNTGVFCSFWIYPTSGVNTGVTGNNLLIGQTSKGRMGINLSHSSTGWGNTVQYNDGSWGHSSQGVLTVGQWQHIAYGFNGTEYYYYKNGVKTVITNSTTYGSAALQYFIVSANTYVTYDVTVSDYIVDGVDRESEIVNHYNITKSLYGL